jgi:hypothetical protein
MKEKLQKQIENLKLANAEIVFNNVEKNIVEQIKNGQAGREKLW